MTGYSRVEIAIAELRNAQKMIDHEVESRPHYGKAYPDRRSGMQEARHLIEDRIVALEHGWTIEGSESLGLMDLASAQQEANASGRVVTVRHEDYQETRHLIPKIDHPHDTDSKAEP